MGRVARHDAACTTCSTNRANRPGSTTSRGPGVRSGHLAAAGRGRHPGRHLQPDDLPEGHRRRAPTTTSSSPSCWPTTASRTPTGSSSSTTSRDALDVLRPVYDASGGTDGFVSRSRWRRRWPTTPRAPSRRPAPSHERIDRPNLMVKIPGTAEGIPAIQAMIAEGVNINVTLIFGLPRYGEVHRGLPRRASRRCEGDLVRRRQRGLVLRQPGRHRGRPPARRHRHRRGARPAGQGRGRPGQARLPAVPRSGSPGPAGRRSPARGARVQRPAVGLDVDQEPRLPRPALRRQPHRPRHGEHHARRHPRRLRRPRHRRPHGRRRTSTRRSGCSTRVEAVGVDMAGRRRRPSRTRASPPSPSPSTSCSRRLQDKANELAA